MTDVPVQISLSLDPTPLLIKSDRSTALTLVGFREVARQKNLETVESDILHGDTLLRWSYQQALLVFAVAARDAATEQAARDAIAALETVLEQFTYTAAVTVGDASAETWRCQPGNVTPGDARDYPDLRHHDPVWNVSIPVHPIRVS